MPRNFYMGKEADVVSGCNNFAQLIASDPASYGISSEEATAFGELNATLQSTYLASANPSTRTTVAVAAKNTALLEMRNYAMLLTKIMYLKPTVSDEQLIGLGLSPRQGRSPATIPETSPRIAVVSVIGRTVKLRVTEAGSTSRGMPYGAAGANIFSFVGTTPPTDARDYRFEKMTTRATIDLQFDNSIASGATVWLSACWVSTRGKTSIASDPMNFTLQGGSVSVAA